MNKNIKRIVIALVISIASVTSAFGNEIDPILKKLDISGFIRTRGWYIGSSIKLPSAFSDSDGYKQAYYLDLFARGRLNIKVNDLVEIKSVFDISAAYGKDSFAIGSGSTNLITRDIYTIFHFSKDSELSIGLRPFSLNGGFIIARDAAGIKYEHKFLKKKINLYTAMIFAYDNANDSLGANSDPPFYAGDYIFYVGGIFKPMANYTIDTYYAIEVDYYMPAVATGDAPTSDRKGVLHWIGFHNKIVLGDLFIKFGGILNFGTLENHIWSDTGSDNIWDIEITTTTNTLAGLWEFSIGYRLENFQISLAAEGATGDPNDTSANSSFQDIKASHGFSLIAVDNSGGIAIRGSGESSWYGLYGQGIKVQFDPTAELSLKLNYFHFRTVSAVSSSTWFGDEIDILVDMKFKNGLSVFVHGGLFLANDAYKGLTAVNHTVSTGLIGELSAGVKVKF